MSMTKLGDGELETVDAKKWPSSMQLQHEYQCDWDDILFQGTFELTDSTPSAHNIGYAVCCSTKHQ